jgi:hypothetical protein
MKVKPELPPDLIFHAGRNDLSSIEIYSLVEREFSEDREITS